MNQPIAMRIISPPVLVGESICRLVSPIASLLEVEEWVGAWWEPSAVTITTASQASQAPVAVLLARGVPREDHATGSPLHPEAVQVLMWASVTPYVQPLAVGPQHELRRGGSRRKVYAGNSRFRRRRSASEEGPLQSEQRERAGAAEWCGPWRRATDDPSSQRPQAS